MSSNPNNSFKFNLFFRSNTFSIETFHLAISFLPTSKDKCPFQRKWLFNHCLFKKSLNNYLLCSHSEHRYLFQHECQEAGGGEGEGRVEESEF